VVEDPGPRAGLRDLFFFCFLLSVAMACLARASEAMGRGPTPGAGELNNSRRAGQMLQRKPGPHGLRREGAPGARRAVFWATGSSRTKDDRPILFLSEWSPVGRRCANVNFTFLTFFSDLET